MEATTLCIYEPWEIRSEDGTIEFDGFLVTHDFKFLVDRIREYNCGYDYSLPVEVNR